MSVYYCYGVIYWCPLDLPIGGRGSTKARQGTKQHPKLWSSSLVLLDWISIATSGYQFHLQCWQRNPQANRSLNNHLSCAYWEIARSGHSRIQTFRQAVRFKPTSGRRRKSSPKVEVDIVLVCTGRFSNFRGKQKPNALTVTLDSRKTTRCRDGR